MKFTKRHIILGIVLVVVIGAIVFLSDSPTKTSSSSNPIKINDDSTRVQEKESKYPTAIELVSPDGYINTDNINISSLIGKKVILVDFWTYSCINCQRTLPYLASWYDKYNDSGLEIIGVHTPEFDFEKDYDNVKKATEKFNVNYPVVLDNEYQTWRAYNNRYWPRKYIIDIDGFIVYDHIGEGAYEETEEIIQRLLEERNEVLGTNESVNMSLTKEDNVSLQKRTPEIYLGYKMTRGNFGSSEGYTPNKVVNYSLPKSFKQESVYLDGSWLNNPENVELVSSSGRLVLDYTGSSINLVAGALSPVSVDIIVDGIKQGSIVVSDFGLYELSSGSYGSHHLELVFKDPGVQVFTFTFG